MGPTLLQGAGVEQLASTALERADFNILELLQHNGLHLSSAVAVSRDWGLIKHLQAAAVLHPTSVHEIAELVRAVASSSSTNLTVAAKGVGHSLMDNLKYVPVSFLLDSADYHQQLVMLELISEQGGPRDCSLT